MEDAAFVTKLALNGSSLVYSTFLNGSNYDEGTKITVDTLYRASVTGYTTSSDFPVTPGAFQTTKGSTEYQTFVTRLSPAV